MKLLANLIIGLFFLVASQNCAQKSKFKLLEIQYSTAKWTGVAVSNKGRIFVNFPRWSAIPFSVAEIKDSQLVPYPDEEWNNWKEYATPNNHFVCVQSVYVDKDNFLWILDPASINGSVVEVGVKLLKIDLQTDSVIQVIYFDESVAPAQSYLNDIRVDTKRNIAYLTESGLGAIIVVDLSTGTSRRVLENHYSVKAEDIQLEINEQKIDFPVHSDGVALSNDRSFLYYKALTGNNLYRIKTEKLRDTSLTSVQLENEVEFVTKTFPCDAIEFDRNGNLFLTSIQDNSIYYLSPELELALQDDRLKWPDSFSITSAGEIYVSSSRILFPQGQHGLFKIVNK